MRGRRDLQTTMLADVDLEERVPPKHPLRVINSLSDSGGLWMRCLCLSADSSGTCIA